MLKNYLLIAIRNLGRNKAFSFVNIFGLSIGLTCSILILLWVHDELTWDRFHTRIDQLYRVYINRIGEQGIYTQKVVPLALLEELENTTGVRYATATNGGGSVTLSYEDKRIERDFYFGNSDFWKMFSFNFVEGADENLRDDVFAILLTESTAKALFGDESALGKAVKVENHVDLTVTGVIKDPPGNSTLQFQCYIPIATMVALEPSFRETLTDWRNSSVRMYIELAPGADAKDLDKRIRDVLKTHRDQTKRRTDVVSAETFPPVF